MSHFLTKPSTVNYFWIYQTVCQKRRKYGNVKQKIQDFIEMYHDLFRESGTKSKIKKGKVLSRRGCEAPLAMAAPVRTIQVNQVIRHPRTTCGVVIVNVNTRSVTADARVFTPNYLDLLCVDLFNSERTVEG